MSLLKNLAVLLAKIEVNYDIDPVPTAVADAILVSNLQLNWPTQVVDREPISNSHSPFAPLQGRKYGQLSFDVELKGSGAAGTAADWGVLLRACGFGETIVAVVSVTYAPISASFESITIYAYRDGLLYKFTGCLGNVTKSFPAGKPAMLSFVFTGHAVAQVDAALPSPTVDTTVPEVVKNASFTINAYAAVLSALNLDMGNRVIIPDDINAAEGYGEVKIAGRTAQGSMDPEATLVAAHDFWSEWEDGTQMALSIVVGSVAGNIATLTAPKVVYREFNEGERDGIYTLDLPFTAARNAGDDEVSLAMT